MQTATTSRALFVVGILAAAGCDPTPGPDDVRTLHCNRVTESRAHELCTRMERELEFKRGGHSMLFGFPAWRCTGHTFERLMCVEPRVDLAILRTLREEPDTMDFSSCLTNLQVALENAARPKSERRPPFDDLECD